MSFTIPFRHNNDLFAPVETTVHNVDIGEVCFNKMLRHEDMLIS